MRSFSKRRSFWGVVRTNPNDNSTANGVKASRKLYSIHLFPANAVALRHKSASCGYPQIVVMDDIRLL
ncbi:MAG: hypothetical protein ABGX28_04815 [Methylococcales bacterium]